MSKEDKEEKCLTCIHKDGDGSVLYGAKVCSQGHMIEVLLEESRTWKTDFSGCDMHESKPPE